MSHPERRMQQVGLDRLIRLRWLEEAARLQREDILPEEIQRALGYYLAPHFRTTATTVRGSLDKTRTILMRTWVRVPPGMAGFRDQGLGLLELRPHEAVAIHWGMIGATYPFWNAVALQVGRLLRLQEDLTSAQAQRRMREAFGERETVSRRVRYVLRAFIDWKVLEQAGAAGHYRCGPKTPLENPAVIAWLVEALLYAQPNHKAFLGDLLASPALFPFRLASVTSAEIVSNSSRLELKRQCLDSELIEIRTSGQ